MRTFIFLVFLFLSGSSLFSQSCPDCRFISPVFDSVTVETVKFGEGINADGNNQELFLDFYQPYGDTMQNRPVVIFAFGGGFIQGNRQEGYVISACERFARAGYTAAAIDYRIGIDWTQFLDPVGEAMRVFFRAMQDMRGAVQYMRAHADSMGNTWAIDTNKIYVGGASAGGITALMVQYCDKDSEFGEIGSLSSISGLGGFYSSSGTYDSYSYETHGTVNIAGAIVNTDWIEAGDPPVINVHGDEDGTVPYEGGNLNLGIANIGLEGSKLVQDRADSVGVCSYLYTIVGGDHPSGSISSEELDQIFYRMLPRGEAIVKGRNFCCDLEVEVTPAGTLYATPGTPVQLTSTIRNDQGNATVEWCAAPCGFHSNNLVININPQQFPSYYIAVVREGNCQNTDFSTLYDGTVSIDGVVEQNGFRVYPNPADNRIYLEGELPADKIVLRDINGKILLEQNSPNHALKQEISLQGLPKGVFFLEVLAMGKVHPFKLIHH